jgi:hypothetical protein
MRLEANANANAKVELLEEQLIQLKDLYLLIGVEMSLSIVDEQHGYIGKSS